MITRALIFVELINDYILPWDMNIHSFFFLYQILVFFQVFLNLFPLGMLIDHGTTQFGAVIAVS